MFKITIMPRRLGTLAKHGIMLLRVYCTNPSLLLMPHLHFQGATPPLYIGSGQDEQKHDDLDDEALTVSLIVIILIVVWSRRHVRTNCSHSLSTRWCVKKLTLLHLIY